ncbi:MAG: DNA-processing protein DprA, partial [Solirubrobacteraceae bacterium]
TEPTVGVPVTPVRERAAVVALLQLGRRPWSQYADRLEAAQSVEELLRAELAADGEPPRLFGTETLDPESILDDAAQSLSAWAGEGISLITVRDQDYPANLREVHDRPPVLFVAGQLAAGDERSVAVIGSRHASREGLAAARTIATELTAAGYVVVSGLAMGIDTAAHTSTLAYGGRTVAVIGTGLRHSYPPQSAALQARLASESAVVSQFWPDAPPSRESFPQRNAVMSGISRGTVIVEASARSGARVQARRALAHGRPVFLRRVVTREAWAGELAASPGVHVIDEPAEITAALRLLEVDSDDELEA